MSDTPATNSADLILAPVSGTLTTGRDVNPLIARGISDLSKAALVSTIASLSANRERAAALVKNGIAWSLRSYEHRDRDEDKQRAHLARAIRDFSEAIRLDSKCAFALKLRGNAWRLMKEFDKALIDYNFAIELDSTESQYYLERGRAWWQMGEFANAVADYDEAVRLDPEEGLEARGDAWLILRAYDRAINDYAAAIRFADPGRGYCAELCMKRAAAWLATGARDNAFADYHAAIRHFEVAIQRFANGIDDDGEELPWLLATCPIGELRNGHRAVTLATVLCKGRRVGYTLDFLAAAYAEAGRFDEAVRCGLDAVNDARNQHARDEYQARLELYKRKTAYREGIDDVIRSLANRKK